MNKEAKVGLTIVFVLLIIFLGVLGNRLYNTFMPKPSLAIEEKNPDETIEPKIMNKETFSKADEIKTAIFPSDKSAVIAASATDEEPLLNTISDEKLSLNESVEESDSGKSPHPSPLQKEEGTFVANPLPKGEETLSDNPLRAPMDTTRSTVDLSGEAAAGKNRTHTVTNGESLFDIARGELGKASRWVEIYDLNIEVLDKELDNLTPGIQIALP